MPEELPFRVFDRNEDVFLHERRLPHWAQNGTLAFITFRMWDSMPERVVLRWLAERNLWLLDHGINSNDPNWKSQFEQLEHHVQQEFHRRFSARWHDELDHCHGSCVLKQAELAETVAVSLKHFDGDRYELTDFIIMPNHVNLLAAFADAERMLAQCESWKHFTATQINRQLGRCGRFWQQDGFDHLIRSLEQFERLRKYIADNPEKAGLPRDSALHFAKDLMRR